ncbi:MAG TPA: carbohydrate-binding family 9-like protein [Candidatus Sulfotelmatobacter sp.]
MNGFTSVFLMLLALSTVSPSPRQAVVESVRADQDVSLNLDPASPFWHDARLIPVEKDRFGHSVPNFRATVRTRWTQKNIYFLFASPYDKLYLKPSPNTQKETNELWNWDVAEVFIGSDFNDIQRYKEFEVSPQGEWVDLDIDLHKPHHEDGWTWNSGFESAARIDPTEHMWYAAMRIPFSAIDPQPPIEGRIFRLNFFFSQGTPDHHIELVWQAPMKKTFHVPERFGLIRLVNK